jgi:nitric oxide dioxygenase
MKNNQIYLVKESFGLIIKTPAETVEQLFYTHLIETSPELCSKYNNTSLTVQIRKMMPAITYIVNSLDSLYSIRHEIASFVKGYTKHGIIEPALYEPIAESLLWALEKGLGTNWTPELKIAWAICCINLFNIITEVCEESETYAGINKP